jgi:hypothetical protein
VPHRHDPHDLSFGTKEEAVGWKNQFPVREIQELGDPAPRVRVAREAAECLLGARQEAGSDQGAVLGDVRDHGQELPAPRLSEADAHRSAARQDVVGFGEDGVAVPAAARADLALALRQELEDRTLPLAALIRVDPEEHRGGAAALGDHQRLPRAADAPERSSRVSAQFGDGDDVGESGHAPRSKSTSNGTGNDTTAQGPRDVPDEFRVGCNLRERQRATSHPASAPTAETEVPDTGSALPQPSPRP